VVCGQEFTPRTSGHIVCSTECGRKRQAQQTRENGRRRAWAWVIGICILLLLGFGLHEIYGHKAASSTTTTTQPNLPSFDDYTFVQDLRQYAPQVSQADAVRFEGLAHGICSDLSAGNTVQQEVTAMYKGKLAVDVAEGVLTGAVDAYCLQFQPALLKWVNSH